MRQSHSLTASFYSKLQEALTTWPFTKANRLGEQLRFAALTPDQQREALGPARYKKQNVSGPTKPKH